MKKRIFLLLGLLLLLLTACGGGNGEETALMAMYAKVYNGVFWWTIGVGFFAALIVAFGALGKTESGGFALGVLIVIFGIHFFGAFATASSKADHAVTTAWEGAKDDQARYNQKVHGVWVDYEEVVHECSTSFISAAGTGCTYVTESCSTDSDGDRDCDYYPWFKYERSLTAVLYDNWQNKSIEFASHIAPADWESNQAGWIFGGVPWGKKPGRDFVFEENEDWLRVKNAIDSGEVLPGSRISKYLNWQHANDRDLYVQYGGNIPQFAEAGVLPTINGLEHVFDYDMVQFSEAISLSPEQEEEWQTTAHMWGGQAGQQIQASLILNFAKASQISDTYVWINSSKAHLQDEQTFGKDILPKNMVLVNCVVDDTQQTITECRLETGMFEGNNGLKLEVADLNGVPFTPKAVFGVINANFAKDGDEFIRDENGWLIPEVSIEGGSLGRLIMDNFVRVEMESKEYLRTSLTPTPEQRAAIYRDAIWGLLKSLFKIYAIILGVLGFGSKKS